MFDCLRVYSSVGVILICLIFTLHHLHLFQNTLQEVSSPSEVVCSTLLGLLDSSPGVRLVLSFACLLLLTCGPNVIGHSNSI